MTKTKLFLFAILLAHLFSSCESSKTVELIDEMQLPATTFAMGDLENALANANYSTNNKASFSIVLKKDIELKEQEYSIKKDGNKLFVSAGGARGAMYGILDLAEQIELKTDLSKIEEKEESPFIEYRGVKMNIALDGRLPSYDDTGDAAQKNIPEMWNMDFWVEYLDELARHRYNMLTFWSKHPFPALCKMEDYPGAAMEDVYVYNKPVTWDIHRDWKGIDIKDKTNLRKIKSMTIDEKIAFWQKVMEHAHNRGIEIVWFTWNIFISPGTGEELKPESDEALVYMRKAVQEMVETYPHLSGFGVTAGERMGMTVGPYTAAQWMFETYGKGVAAAKETNPERPFRFIFRRHHCTLPAIQKDFADHFPGETQTSYKYSVARAYGATHPPIFEQEYLDDVKAYDFKCWMNVRNDDVFTFRWGDPDFVREYLKGFMSYGVVPGFYIGSDGYLWGREFTSKIPELSGELEITKHWYREMLWGRLGYNPELSDSFFKNVIASKFPEIDANALYNAWRYSSKVTPAVSNFHWKPADAMWSAEGCMDQYNDFQSLRDFIDCFTLEKDRLQNITDYVSMLKSGGSSTAKSPLELADSLRFCSAETYKYLNGLRKNSNAYSAELVATLNDIECNALYGEYYAGKIAGATYLHMYENLPGDKKDLYKEKALEEATKAAEAWKKLAQIADSQYKVQLLARTRELDWIKRIADVENDIEIVKSSTGEEPKVAKIFISGYTKITPQQKKKLDEFLISKGYRVEDYAGWKVQAYATGLKIAIANHKDIVAQFFTSRGGAYPEDFESKGFYIEEVDQKVWLVSTDSKQANKGIDALINNLQKQLN